MSPNVLGSELQHWPCVAPPALRRSAAMNDRHRRYQPRFVAMCDRPHGPGAPPHRVTTCDRPARRRLRSFCDRLAENGATGGRRAGAWPGVRSIARLIISRDKQKRRCMGRERARDRPPCPAPPRPSAEPAVTRGQESPQLCDELCEAVWKSLQITLMTAVAESLRHV